MADDLPASTFQL